MWQWLKQHMVALLLKLPSCWVRDPISSYISYEIQTCFTDCLLPYVAKLLIACVCQIPGGMTNCHHLNPNGESHLTHVLAIQQIRAPSALLLVQRAPSYVLKEGRRVILIRSNIILLGA